MVRDFLLIKDVFFFPFCCVQKLVVSSRVPAVCLFSLAALKSFSA